MPDCGPERSGMADIQPLRSGDVHFAAALHRLQLPHGLFFRLGDRFLVAYYRTFVDSPHACARLALVDDRPVGALVGTLRNGAHYRWVLRHRGVRLAAVGIAALLLRPLELLRFTRTRLGRYARGAWRLANRRRAGADGDGKRVAVLSHVAVSPTAQGRGIGRCLVEDFLAACRDAGADEAVLATLAGEDGAAAFYRRQGWLPHGEYRNPDGILFTRFAKPL